MWITERTHREKQKSSWLNTGCPLISCVIMMAPPVLIGLMHMSVQARILWRWEGEKHWERGWSQVSALSLDLVFIQIMGAGVIQIQTLRSGGGRAGFKNFFLPFAEIRTGAWAGLWRITLYSEIRCIALCVLHIVGFSVSVPSIILADLLGNMFT